LIVDAGGPAALRMIFGQTSHFRAVFGCQLGTCIKNAVGLSIFRIFYLGNEAEKENILAGWGY